MATYPTVRTPRYAYGDAGRSGSTMSRESAVTAATTPSIRFFGLDFTGRTFSFSSSLTAAFAMHQVIAAFPSWWTRPAFVSAWSTLHGAESVFGPCRTSTGSNPAFSSWSANCSAFHGSYPICFTLNRGAISSEIVRKMKS